MIHLYRYMSPFFKFFPQLGCSILSRVPCTKQLVLVGYSFTSVRRLSSKNPEAIGAGEGVEREGKPPTPLGRMYIGAATKEEGFPSELSW